MNSVYEDDRVCILSCLHPAYCHKREADVAGTIERNRPIQYGDDYDLTEQTAHLDLPGEFQ